MKLEQRKRWHGIVALHIAKRRGEMRQAILKGKFYYDIGYILCGWCKYMDWEKEYGEYDTVLASYPVCYHDLKAISEHAICDDDYYHDYADCWGFRPQKKWSEVTREFGVTIRDAEIAYEDGKRNVVVLNLMHQLFKKGYGNPLCWEHRTQFHLDWDDSLYYRELPPEDCTVAYCRQGCPVEVKAKEILKRDERIRTSRGTYITGGVEVVK